MERNYQRIPVSHGNYVIGSRRGTSSHQYSPFLILTEEGTTEDAGACYAMSFVYSGGFQAEVEKDQFGQNRMLMGLQPEQFFVSSEYRRSLCHTGNRDDLQQKRAGRAFPESAPVFSEQSVQGPS